MRVIRDGERVTYVAPGVALPSERAAAPSEEVRRRWASALAASEQTMKDLEALRRRQAAFRQVVDAGWLLDDDAFGRRLAERSEAMYAAAERVVEFFRRLD